MPPQLLGALAGERVELLADRRAERRGRSLRIAVRAAGRLGHDPVDHPELLEILRGHLHRLGRLRRLLRGAPEDPRAALGRDHRIDRVLEHQHALGAGQRHRAARAALADDRRDHRHRQREARLGRAGDRLGLAALLGLDAGIGARRVDQRHHRQAEAAGELHQPDRLAVAFGLAHAEIVLEPALGVVALLVPDQHDLAPADRGEAAHDRLVVAVMAIAGERHEFLERERDVVAEMRPRGCRATWVFCHGVSVA